SKQEVQRLSSGDPEGSPQKARHALWSARREARAERLGALLAHVGPDRCLSRTVACATHKEMAKRRPSCVLSYPHAFALSIAATSARKPRPSGVARSSDGKSTLLAPGRHLVTVLILAAAKILSAYSNWGRACCARLVCCSS